jgi:hypothetical protein
MIKSIDTLNAEQEQQLEQWLKIRLGDENIILLTIPQEEHP